MSQQSDAFRLRAKNCRSVADITRDRIAQNELRDMANHLDEEAAAMDREDAAAPPTVPKA